MTLELSHTYDIATIRLPSRLDTNTAPDAERDLTRFIAYTQENVLFDCSEMTYISSIGIRVLLICTKNLMKSGRKVSFCCLTAHVREVFTIGGFTKIFAIFDSPEKALESLK